MTIPRPTLDAIARPGGGLAMIAMDQRESLRSMFDLAGSGRPADRVLVDFKRAVATELADLASGFLIDRDFGGMDVLRDGLLPQDCGFILAADALEQQDGGPVEDTGLDAAALGDAAADGVAAIKLLIIWRRDARREARVALAQQFIAEAEQRGVLSVLEPVVRATAEELDGGTWNQEDAIREAARELSALRPSLYKVQVPLAGAGSASEQLAESERLAGDITGPWVVLSQGVALNSFAAAVEAACRAGASGFLAGRALWSDVVGAPDAAAALRERSRPRLERLAEIVDSHARPWTEA
jgi:sulfofructosephosphate aldolase